MIVYMILLFITALFAYIIGSLDTMVIASNFVFHRSLRRLGQGDVWLSNFRRIYGYGGFLKLLAVELVKDIIPILIGGLLLGFKEHADVGRAFAGFCMVLGRLYPIFYRFRGGHASLAMAVAAFSADISVGIATLVVIALATFVTKYPSVGAVIGAFAFLGVSVIVVDDSLLTKLAIFTAALVIFKHIPAMIRVFRGTEIRFSNREDITYKLDE